MWLYYVIEIAVLFTTIAMTVREGLWHNLVLACNIMLSAIIAFGFYQPLTIAIDEWSDGSYTYVLDMLVFWVIFIVAISLLKQFGKMLAPEKVKFLHPLNNYAGPLLGVFCGIMMACTTAASLHMAPLPRETMGGALTKTEVPDNPLPINLSADVAFLGAANMFTAPAGLGDGGEFNARLWAEDYANRRERLEEVVASAKSALELRVKRRPGRRDLP